MVTRFSLRWFVGFACMCCVLLLFVFWPHAKADQIVLENIYGKENIVPVAVIGSGPAGCAAAMETSRGGYYTVVFEGKKPGGLLTTTTAVENWPGIASKLGPELMDDFKNQVERWGVEFISETITKVDFSSWPYALWTSENEKIYALTVVIATGATPRSLGIPGEQEYWGNGVTTCAICDAPLMKNKDVVVVGGGDSAIEQVFQLSPYVKSIKVFVRKDQMRASNFMQDSLKGYPKAEVLFNRVPQKILGNGEEVTGVEVLNTKTNQIEHYPISGFFLAIGHDPATSLFKGQLELNQANCIVCDRRQETSKKAVFVAGEAEDNLYRQAITALGDGAKAGLGVNYFLQSIGFSMSVAEKISSSYFKPYMIKFDTPAITSMEGFNEKVMGSKKRVVLDFWNQFCAPCRQMLPVFKSLAYAKRSISDISFYKVNIDDVPSDLLETLHVLSIPCFIIFQDGKMIARYQGTMTKDQLKEFAEDLKLPTSPEE